MRKITQQVISAFRNNKNFKSGNDSTTFNPTTGKACLFLHGNLIAEKDANGTYITTAGWNTPTTKDRLNGIPGVSVYTQKHQLYLNGDVWDGKMIKIS